LRRRIRSRLCRWEKSLESTSHKAVLMRSSRRVKQAKRLRKPLPSNSGKLLTKMKGRRTRRAEGARRELMFKLMSMINRWVQPTSLVENMRRSGR
jgi:hypothetical protein